MALDDLDGATGHGAGTPGATALAEALEEEAAALDRLCHCLEVQRFVLEGARGDMLARAGRDVETALVAVRSSDLVRAVTVSTYGAATGEFHTLGHIASQVASSSRPHLGTVLVEVGQRLERSLARAVSLADENRARIAVARDRLADDELAMWVTQWAEEFGRAVEDLHRLVDEPAQPQQRLAEVENALFGEEDERLARALADLRLQAIAFDAALGLLQTIGCRPLLEFIADLD